MNVFIRAMVRIFSFGETWIVPIKSQVVMGGQDIMTDLVNIS